jgi:hypothetical protein
MPMYFGYRAHRHYGLGWIEPRSGKLMQADPGYPLRWDRIKREADANPEFQRRIDAALRHGFSSREIVDYVEADPEGVIAEIRRRKGAFDRSSG